MTMRLPGFERKQGAPRGDKPLAASVSASNDDLRVSFIVITGDDEFYSRLREIAGSCQWSIGRAASIDEAAPLLKATPTPLVVYEHDSNSKDRTWRNAFSRLSESPAHPCLLLASQVADDNLLGEVVRHHGYDILAKSLPGERIIQCLNFAWFWARSRSHSAV